MSRRDRDPRSELATTVGFLGMAAVVGYTVLSAKLGIPFAIPVGIIGAVGGTIVLRGPLGHALLGRQETVPDETAGQLLAEVDELRARVQELEERADFADRLLTERSQRPGSSTGD